MNTGNKLGNEGAKAISELVKTNTRLCELNLGSKTMNFMINCENDKTNEQ